MKGKFNIQLFKSNHSTVKREKTCLPPMFIDLDLVLGRPISVTPGLKVLFHVCMLHSYALLRVTFCVIITVSRSEGSTVFWNLMLHVLRQENRAWNFGLIWVKLNHLSRNRALGTWVIPALTTCGLSLLLVLLAPAGSPVLPLLKNDRAVL